jgi:hypothetical protein
MIGAFAYGWPLTKTPIAGVQPIRVHAELPTTRPTTNPTLLAPRTIPRADRTRAGARTNRKSNSLVAG